MKKLISVLLILAMEQIACAVNLPISNLPLGSGSSTGINDSFPYTNVAAGTPYRLKIPDLLNVPAISSKFNLYAPLASPTFSGVVTTPALTIPTGATNGFCWTAIGSSGVGAWQACASGGSTTRTVQGTYTGPVLLNSSTGITAQNYRIQMVYIAGQGAAVDLSAVNPQISAGFSDGDEMIVYGTSVANTVKMSTGNGLALNGDVTFGNNTVIKLVWSVGAAVWTAQGYPNDI